MLASVGNLYAFLTLGFGGGLFLFFKGFRVYRECRVLEDTPEIPIRSIAMGLAHIHGKAKSGELMTSPVTNSPCCFYKVNIERWQSDGKSSSWHHYATDVDGIRFYLEDGSGKVLVDARDAELDLIENGKREVGAALHRLLSDKDDFALATGSGPTDSELLSYVGTIGAKHVGSFVARGLNAAGHQSGEHREQAGLDLLEAGKHPAGSPELNERTQRAAEAHGDNQVDVEKFVSGIEGLQHSMEVRWGVSGGSGRYRFTEYCILPDHWYDVTGTCAENPTPKDDGDRNLILKGQNEPTFLISWRAQQGVESHLRQRAALMVFGGAVLAVACLGGLLAKLGLF